MFAILEQDMQFSSSAELVRYGDFIEARLPDEAMLSLKNLTRFRTYLVDSISDLKRKVICVLDQVFPEYQSVFSDVFGVTSKEILLLISSHTELEISKVLARITQGENIIHNTDIKRGRLTFRSMSVWRTSRGKGNVYIWHDNRGKGKISAF